MEPGQKLAHYTIVEQIGVGGMGEVYRAQDTTLGREVALKILPAAFAADPARVARFQREAKLLASLNHPNIAAIHSVAQDGDRVALALELVAGDDLSAHLLRGPLPLDKALAIAEQIAAAVEAAHEQGVVHRDLKPANIKIAPDGVVKVLDFGLAKATDPAGESASSFETTISPSMASAVRTQDGVILGTAAYMSPEQARGANLDRRTDIFSFGVVLFEMLTGGRPFGGPTMSDVMAAILKEEPDQATLPGDTPPAIRLLLRRCLAKDPKQRLRDMGEARLLIAAVRAGDPAASAILGAPEQSAGRRGIAPREIAAWSLVLLAVAALGFTLTRPRTGPAAAAPPKTYNLSMPVADDADLRYDQGGVVISPDGTRLAYINHDQLYIRRLDDWDPVPIGETAGVSSPFWSPDGSWLAYCLHTELWKVRQDGTQRTLVGTAESPFSDTSGGAWLADDRLVYRGVTDLMAIPAAGGVPAVFVPAVDSTIIDYHRPSALPGGQGVVTAIHTMSGVDAIGVAGLDGVLHTVLAIAGASLDSPVCSPSGRLIYMDKGSIWAVQLSQDWMKVTGQPYSVARDAALASVASDGTLAYVRHAGTAKRRLVLVDRAGTVQARLGQAGDIWPAYALSPDGTRAAAAAGSGGSQDLFLHDLREGRSRVTFTEIEHDMTSFSPDGKAVYFSTGTQTNYHIGRQVIDSNETEETVIPAGAMGPHYFGACPAVGRDGRILFYTGVGANKKQDVAWYDLEAGGEPHPFLNSDAAEYAARPSPAMPGIVAYVSDESGQAQVYLTSWPTPGRRWVVSAPGGNWPRWKGDGSELYYAQGAEIYAVKVNYDPVQISPPQALFTRADPDERQPFGWPAVFDVSADGERFLDTELVASSAEKPIIAVVPQWDRARTSQR